MQSAPGVSIPLNPMILSRPPIEFSNFRSEAYVIQPAYREVSALNYSLTRNANVSIVLMDPNGNSVRTLASNVAQAAGSHTLEWNGQTGDGRTVSTEGDYTVLLTAVDPVSGLSYKRRGAVVVYQ